MNAALDAQPILQRMTCDLTAPHREILAILMRIQGYRSPTEALESFLGHWAMAPHKHQLTGRHAAHKGYSREERGRQLLALLRSGRSMGGRWLLRRVYDTLSLLASMPPQEPEPVAVPVTFIFPPLKPRVSVNLTGAYAAILAEMCLREGYRSPAEAFESFLGHWALAAHQHKHTGHWAAARGLLRERRGRELLAILRSGQPLKGSWIRNRVHHIIEDVLGANSKSPTVDEVLAILPDVVDSTLEKEFG